MDPLPPGIALTVGRLAADSRILGWAEGLHQRAPYLRARNAVVRHLVESGLVRIVAAETHFASSRIVDAYLAGSDGAPFDDVVAAVWSWGGEPLADNAVLVRWLRSWNDRAPVDRRVRFFGLDAFGDRRQWTGELDDSDDRRLAASLAGRRAAHEEAGGTHRDLAVRDGLQYEALTEIASRFSGENVLLFEQTEHLDAREPGSLGARLADGALGTYRAVGATWDDDDPASTYPLGAYASLARHARTSVDRRPMVPDVGFTPLDDETRETLGTDFTAVIHADRLTPAARLRE